MRHSHSDIDFGDAKIASVSIKTILCMVYLISHGCMLGSNSMLKKKKKLSGCTCQRHLFSVQRPDPLFYWKNLGFHLILPSLLQQNHHEVLTMYFHTFQQELAPVKRFLFFGALIIA